MAQRRRNTPGKGPVRPNKNAGMRQKAKRLGYQPPNKNVKSWAMEKGWSKPVQMGGVPIPEAPNYNVQKAAENQVALSQQGLLDEIAAQQNATWDQYQEADRGAQSIGEGAMNMFSKPQALQNNFQQAGQTFNQNLQGMPGMDAMQGSAGPAAGLAPENQAQQALGAQLGSNTHAALMGQQQQALQSQAGNRDQFAVDLATRRANYLEKAQDALQALNEGRLDVLQDDPMQILAQRNTLADQRFGQESARFGMGMDYEQMSSDDALRKAIQKLIRGELGGGGGGGGNNRPPGGGDGNPQNNANTGVQGPQSGQNPRNGTNTGTQGPQGGGGQGGPLSLQELLDRRQGYNQNIRSWDERYGIPEVASWEKMKTLDGNYWQANYPGGGGTMLRDLVDDPNTRAAMRHVLNKRKATQTKIRRRGNKTAGKRRTS